MANPRKPRKGSMQFYPRVRAASQVARIRNIVIPKDAKIEGFYGYKVGMGQVSLKDTYANSLSKNQTIVKCATFLECPPLKVVGLRFYRTIDGRENACGDFFSEKFDKELTRSMNVPKAKEIPAVEFNDVRLIVHTQPKLTGLSKKKPEVFEMRINGTKDEKLAYAKEKLGKEIDVTEAFKQNEQVDIHGVTKGKGFQGPVKRFKVQIRFHKSEKVKRGPGSLGPWKAQQHIMYRVAHAGQMGYHLRTEWNKPILYIGKDVDKINPIAGFGRFGTVRSTFMILQGTVVGPKKRMLRLIHAQRPNDKIKIRAEKSQLLKVYS